MAKTVLNVEGMSCSHCEKTVKKSVGAVEGVTEVTVDLKKKTVTVVFEDTKVSIADIKKEIEEQGYEVM
ncbi:MAG: copper ion binding protein [Eubacteriales bacterium]